MSETKHTPLPWTCGQCHTRRGAAIPYFVNGTENDQYGIPERICDTPPITWTGNQRANAEFIVRACNAHDDLLAACKAIIAAPALQMGKDVRAAARKCIAAIAKAEQP